MLTVSVHGIALHAYVGLYPEEKITGNDFEIDVDVHVDTADIQALPFLDYSLINEWVHEAFSRPGELLEQFVKDIHTTVKKRFPEASSVKVLIRKLNPPMKGTIKYVQVMFEG